MPHFLRVQNGGECPGVQVEGGERGEGGEIDLCNDINLLNKKIRNIFMQTYKFFKSNIL